MRSVAVLSCLVFALVAASTTQAGLVRPFKKSDSTSLTIKKIKVNLHHVQFVCDNGKGYVRQIHCRATRWLSSWLKQISTPVIAHYAGWLCIHSGYRNGVKVSPGEGSWTDDGAPYFGGLQMHENWYGVYHANLLSPLQQMAAAEKGFRQSGFSHAWMAGQWPITYPPCAGLF